MSYFFHLIIFSLLFVSFANSKKSKSLFVILFSMRFCFLSKIKIIFINQLDKDNLPTNLPNSLCDIYEEMCPNNFGRLIAYLTLVYQVADSCEEEIFREVAQRTVEDFRYIDLGEI